MIYHKPVSDRFRNFCDCKSGQMTFKTPHCTWPRNIHFFQFCLLQILIILNLGNWAKFIIMIHDILTPMDQHVLKIPYNCLWNIFFLNFVTFRSQENDAAAYSRCWLTQRKVGLYKCGAGAKIFSLRPEPNYIRSTAVHTFWPRNRYNSNISHKHSWQLEISYS